MQNKYKTPSSRALLTPSQARVAESFCPRSGMIEKIVIRGSVAWVRIVGQSVIFSGRQTVTELEIGKRGRVWTRNGF